MKKKILLIGVLCAFGLCTWEAQALNYTSTPVIEGVMTDPPQGYEKIELQGSLMYGINPNAIIAGASDDAVYIGFNEDLGNVNISIYNDMGGLVYSTMVNTGVQSVIIIPFGGVASGTYIVELNSADGYADGDFEHN